MTAMSGETVDVLGVMAAASYELQEDEFEPGLRRPMAEAREALVEMLEAQKEALVWLRGALDCKEFIWDEDQHEASEFAYANAVAALSRIQPDGQGE